jgi:hypothetical protein
VNSSESESSSELDESSSELEESSDDEFTVGIVESACKPSLRMSSIK